MRPLAGWVFRGLVLLFALSGVGGAASAQQGAACQEAAAACRAEIGPACLGRRVGAGPIAPEDVASGAGCGEQFERYRGCLREAAARCGPGAGAAGPGCSEAISQQLFDAVADSEDAEEIAAFLEACPNAPQAPLARVRLKRLTGAAETGGAVSEPPLPVAPPSTRFPLDRHIREAQAELRRLRLYDGAVDMDWGPQSQTAMAAFQRQAGLSPADGRLTEASLAALKAAETPPPPGPADFEEFRDCADCPAMIALPAGAFVMGSPPDEKGRDADEGPQRRVSVPRVAIGKYEVTFAQWDACVDAGGCSHRPEDQGWGRGERPVINVSWDDAQAYVRWLSAKTGAGYRLPSEAEWEFAARAGTSGRFSNDGDERISARSPIMRIGRPAISERNTACSDGVGKQTAPVGSFAANPWGLYDVHGNVWEWVQDCWHDSSYRGAPTDGSAWMNGDRGDCSRAVVRGGSWYNDPQGLRSADRIWFSRGYRDYFTGFRVSRTLPAR